MLERIVKDTIVDYLKKNKLIYNSQHGFRQSRSCLTNLLEYFQMVSDQADEGIPSDVVYLDFSKTFDKVPHNRLLLKLQAIGIKGKLWHGLRRG